ncbi:helix-turn-helix transcriptional regulator [Cohaesibacter intestini]|uniref:helix-turn-helix transcriptional regulator n=1 Tax=Cohaesibacter intestini TaxID=2211145 RepID=UPI000DEAC13C|nr:helix-turn-helix transcriptional regulator [Cohaesibacter intestini]
MTESKIVNRLRELRQGPPKMTQQALADALNVSRQTIIAIENGRYAPSLALALRISQLMDRPVEDIFSLPLKEQLTGPD